MYEQRELHFVWNKDNASKFFFVFQSFQILTIYLSIWNCLSNDQLQVSRTTNLPFEFEWTWLQVMCFRALYENPF